MRSNYLYEFSFNSLLYSITFITLLNLIFAEKADKEEVPICGGFIDFDSNINPDMKKQIEYSSITVQSYTSDMILKDHTNLAQSGYYFLPIYDNESFILKITGPYGMHFEPEQYVFTLTEGKTIQDICKGDINFKFRGFIVEGQVSTFGTNDGPSGITLGLYDEADREVQTTVTVDRGMFKFKPLLPNKYILKPIKSTYMFDINHKELAFQVNVTGSNFFERALIIRGFKVTGKVEADGGPLPGILSLIYSYNTTLISNYKCENANKIDNLKDFVYKGLTPFCSTLTDKNVSFIY